MARPPSDGRARPRRAAPRLGVRLFVTALAGLMGLLLVELAARVLDLRPPPLYEREGELIRTASDPRLIFEPRPGSVQRIFYRERHDDVPRVVEMRVNEQGFRGPLAQVPKPVETFRIACVGDSHTFGWGVQEDETWPAHLARELATAYPGRDIEVLNCGVNNYDTVQEVLWMRQRVLAFEPDLVLLQFYVNDVVVRGVKPLNPSKPDRLLMWTSPGRGGRLDALRARSRFLDLVCDGIYRRRGLGYYSAERGRLYAEDEPGWRMVRASLREARDELAARDTPFAVVLYPFLVREGAGLTSRGPFRTVTGFLADEGMTHLDAEQAFLSHDVDRLRISPHDYHGNSEANLIFARAVLDGLVRAVLAERLLVQDGG